MEPISTMCGISEERAAELVNILAETNYAIKARGKGVTVEDMTSVRVRLSENEVLWVTGLLLEAVRQRMG